MKRQITRISSPACAPRLLPGGLTRKYFLLAILLPALLWYGAIHSRSYLIQPRCLATSTAGPPPCMKEELPLVDQFLVGHESGLADGYSFFTQNLSGALAVVIPTSWNVALFLTGRLSPVGGLLVTLGTDLGLVLQTVAWNGVFTELSHTLSQRPRPFVYSDPMTRGIDPAHYTSFYSGHTSFAAATQVVTLLILLARGAPYWLIILQGILCEVLIFSTAYFRMLAGRHFYTDVMCGAIGGTLAAVLVIAFYQRISAQKNGSSLA